MHDLQKIELECVGGPADGHIASVSEGVETLHMPVFRATSGPGRCWHNATYLRQGNKLVFHPEPPPAAVTPQQEIGLSDRDGVAIREGDIVEFWFDEHRGYSYVPNPHYTRMVDVVKWIDGAWCFWSEDIQQGSYAFRHAPHCRVIGSVYGGEGSA